MLVVVVYRALSIAALLALALLATACSSPRVRVFLKTYSDGKLTEQASTLAGDAVTAKCGGKGGRGVVYHPSDPYTQNARLSDVVGKLSGDECGRWIERAIRDGKIVAGPGATLVNLLVDFPRRAPSWPGLEPSR
jgi:hypothetical protein